MKKLFWIIVSGLLTLTALGSLIYLGDFVVVMLSSHFWKVYPLMTSQDQFEFWVRSVEIPFLAVFLKSFSWEKKLLSKWGILHLLDGGITFLIILALGFAVHINSFQSEIELKARVCQLEAKGEPDESPERVAECDRILTSELISGAGP